MRAYDAAIENIDAVAGEVFNIGGGMNNTISIWAEFGPALEKLMGHEIPIMRADWRPGDQKVFVADIRKAGEKLDWQPAIDLQTGMPMLFDWIVENRALFE
jgi:CDP-paratose 2-epimerase